MNKAALTLPSFAKINWHLRIRGKRPDGYHEVVTVLQLLDLHDDLSFELTEQEIHIETSGRKVAADATNLAFRAAILLQSWTGIRCGVRIRLTKRIPVAAGLGGGSSNAATSLLALNQLWGCGLSLSQLVQLARGLGSDVAFFLYGGTALGLGRGEEIHPFPPFELSETIVLVYPPLEISTASAYSLLRSESIPASAKLTTPDVDTTILRFREILDSRAWGDLANDLENPVLTAYPVIAEIKAFLLEQGCEHAMLSGSGSAVLGVTSVPRAAAVREKCSEKGLGECILARTFSAGEHWSALVRAGLAPLGLG